MLIDTKNIISITQLQRELTQKVRDVISDGESLYITKNSQIKVAVISFEELEYLRELEEIFEQFEVKDLLDKRLRNYDPGKNVSWENVREDI